MTLDELEKINGEFLDISTVSKYLNKSPQFIRDALRRGVPWGYDLGGSDYRIPKRAFISYHKSGFINSPTISSYRQPDRPAVPGKQAGKFNIDFNQVSRKLTELNKQMSVIIELIERAGKIAKDI